MAVENSAPLLFQPGQKVFAVVKLYVSLSSTVLCLLQEAEKGAEKDATKDGEKKVAEKPDVKSEKTDKQKVSAAHTPVAGNTSQFLFHYS